MKDHVAGRVQFARALLHVGREVDALLRVGRLRRQLADLEGTHLHECAVGGGFDARARHLEIGNRGGIGAVEIERVVVLERQVGAVERTGCRERSAIAGDRSLQGGSACDGLLSRELRQCRKVDGFHAIFQVRR